MCSEIGSEERRSISKNLQACLNKLELNVKRETQISKLLGYLAVCIEQLLPIQSSEQFNAVMNGYTKSGNYEIGLPVLRHSIYMDKQETS